MNQYFITFEGVDSSGKTTQIALLNKRLEEEKGITTKLFREPGGSEFSERIRNLLMFRESNSLSKTDALLFYAARYETLHKHIVPYLTQGQFVLLDRYYDSTTVYQGYAGNADLVWLEQLKQLVVGDFHPALTFIIDLPIEISIERQMQRNQRKDYYESKNLIYKQKIREGYHAISQIHKDRCVLVDGNQSIEEVHEVIYATFCKRYHL